MGFITGQDMAMRFLEESKKRLDSECGRAALPTAQALYLMYATATWLGRDRGGTMFRLVCFEILRKLQLERRFRKLKDDDPDQLREKKVISKALWGFFIVERFLAHVSFTVSVLALTQSF
jgi:hypothetical protein